MSKKFPKTIYVQIEKESSGIEYINADFDAESIDDGKVAVYELKNVVTKRTEVHLD